MWFTASNGMTFEIGQAVINPNPVPAMLSITKTHTGNFSLGQTNAVLHSHSFESAGRQPHQRVGDRDRHAAFRLIARFDGRPGVELHGKQLHAQRRAYGGRSLSADNGDGST